MLTYEQFTDWADQYNRQPWGEQRQDRRLEVLAEWLLAPYAGDGAPPLPSQHFPYEPPHEPTIPELYQYQQDLEKRLEEARRGADHRKPVI